MKTLKMIVVSALLLFAYPSLPAFAQDDYDGSREIALLIAGNHSSISSTTKEMFAKRPKDLQYVAMEFRKWEAVKAIGPKGKEKVSNVELYNRIAKFFAIREDLRNQGLLGALTVPINSEDNPDRPFVLEETKKWATIRNKVYNYQLVEDKNPVASGAKKAPVRVPPYPSGFPSDDSKTGKADFGI